MDKHLETSIEALPPEKFQEAGSGLANLTPAERLRWLQQTAWFIWRHRGAARTGAERSPEHQHR